MSLLKLPTEPDTKKEYKLCVLGEGGVGKSCLVI
jgi:GTPase SAR1 family protein